MTGRSRTAALAGALLAVAAPAAATPAQDLDRAYLDLARASNRAGYLTARDEAQRYLAANGPQFTAAFIVAMADCMLHPHQAGNAAAFQQLGVDYDIAGPKRLDVNKAIRQCTSPPPPPPPPPQAGVSIAGLTERPDFGLARPSDDVPPPRHPRAAPAAPPPPRAAAAPIVAPVAAPPAPPRPSDTTDRCLPGYVWREALVGDHVCVTPQTRLEVRDDNLHARERRDPGGRYGLMSCIAGYVWRATTPGDAVCVVPQRRDQAAADNAAAASRRAGP